MFNFYWVYDLPNWLFAATTIVIYVLFGWLGLVFTRTWVRKLHNADRSHNDIVGYYLAAVTVFYGITLGLVAVGTWNTFTEVGSKVDQEAQVLSSIFRDVGGYSEPWKTELRQDIKGYVEQVIQVSWPQQQQGIVPAGTGLFLDRFQDHLMSFQPKTMSEQINQAEVFKQYNELVEIRRGRLNAVQTSLPASLWALVIVGGLICVVATFFFDVKSFWMHFWMTSLLSVLLGLMVFLIGTLDNPFRGKVSVSVKPFKLVYHQLILPKVK